MGFLLPYWTALVLGSVHALEADHMAAVTSFAVRRPAPRDAIRFGIQWAIGHGAVVIAAGAVLLFIGLSIPDAATAWLEKIVGGVLILLGGSTMLHAARLHAHGTAGHAHLHSHKLPQPHGHSHAEDVEPVHSHAVHSHSARSPHAPGRRSWSQAPTAIGALHGLAGAAPAVALLQVATMNSVAGGMLYLTIFAVGTAIGMAAYAAITGFVAGRAALASERAARVVGLVGGLATIAIGFFWILR